MNNGDLCIVKVQIKNRLLSKYCQLFKNCIIRFMQACNSDEEKFLRITIYLNYEK